MQLSEAVPWGRSAGEYIDMFGLTPDDTAGRIIDCGGGPSSFNRELTERGGTVVSCDPLYTFSAEQIGRRIDETYPRITALTESSRERFLWDRYGSPDRLGELRMATMRRFLSDYESGLETGRYVATSLPILPFGAGSFDLALCSHLLFTYSEQLSESFHVKSVLEMARVATEVRVFPVVTAFQAERSPHLDPVMERVRAEGYRAELRRVLYEFQKAGNEMLVVSRRSYI